MENTLTSNTLDQMLANIGKPFPHEITAGWAGAARLKQLGIASETVDPFGHQFQIWIDPTLGPNEFYFGKPKRERLEKTHPDFLVRNWEGKIIE